jgi:hypothetical protein
MLTSLLEGGNASFMADVQINEMPHLGIKVVESFVDGGELMAILQPYEQHPNSDGQGAQKSYSDLVHVSLHAVDTACLIVQ